MATVLRDYAHFKRSQKNENSMDIEGITVENY